MSWNEDEKNIPDEDEGIKLTPRQKRMAHKAAHSDVDPTAAMHVVVEAVEVQAQAYLISLEEKGIISEDDNAGQMIEKLVAKGDTDAAMAVGAVAMIRDLHEVLHQFMTGDGIKDITNEDIKDIVFDWYNSSEFDKRYSAPRAITDKIVGAK